MSSSQASQLQKTATSMENIPELTGLVGINVGVRIDPSYRHKEDWDTAVYSATIETESGGAEEVAVKVLKNPTDEHKAEFLIETEILTALDHPNIVGLIDASNLVDNNAGLIPYMVKERANMGTLAQHMHDLTDEEYLRINRDVAHALAYLEEHLIVDGDIKPENIGLFKTDRGEITAKILDFGSARPIDNNPENFGIEHSEELDNAVKLLVKSHSPITQDFAAPEILSGKSPTSKTDVYALGRLALLIGSKSTSEDIGRIRVDPDIGTPEFVIDPMETYIPGRSLALQEFIRKTLCINPSRRPSGKEAVELLATA